MHRRNGPTKLVAGLMLISILVGCSRPTAVPTASPVPVNDQPEGLFQDDFSDPSSGWRKAWPRILETPYGAEYQDGAYRLWVDNDQGVYDIVVATSGRSFDNVRLEVDVRRVSGVDFAGAFLVCRFDAASGSFYYFKLDGGGSANIGIYLDGEDQRVVFKQVPAGLLEGEWVRFGAGCLGSTLSVTVGGETIFELEETSLQSGEVGLGAGEGDEGRTEIWFDNFVAQAPASAVGAVAAAEDSAPGVDEEVGVILEPPPPSGLIDGLLARVAAGEWTYEQALITGLKFLVGEADLASAVGTEIPFSLEGTGVVIEAARYLRSGADPSARAEIERLLTVISPPQDRLDEYSSPADDVSVRPPGLASPFHADDACNTLASKGLPAGSKVKCLLYLEKALNPGTARIYYPATWGKDSSQAAYAKAALQALQDSWARFSKLGEGKMQNVRVVFTLIASAQSPKFLAEVTSWGNADTCVILVYPSALTDSEPVFKQTVAHEAFHCYQGWNFPDHFNSAWDVQDWWGESTAEYFSNVVYPSVNDEWNRIGEFDSASAFKSLLLMSYENASFFQYLANEIGDAGILALINKMPVLGGISEQTAALAGIPNIESLFREFGKALIDGQIVDTSKAKWPTGVLGVPDGHTPTLGPASPSKANLLTWPFTLVRYLVTFAPGKMYAVEVKETGPAGAYDARRLGLKGAWGSLPSKTATGCNAGRYYVLVTSSTAAGSAPSYSVDVTATVEHDAGCDPCLKGKWMLEHDSLADYLAAPFAATPGVFQYLDAGGMWLYTFFSNGNLAANINYSLGYQLNQGSETLPLTTEVVLTMEGEGAGSYWVDAPGTLGLLGASSSLKMEQTIAINGQIVASDSPIPLNPLPKGASMASYECTPTTLVFWPADAEKAGLPPLSFERIESAP